MALCGLFQDQGDAVERLTDDAVFTSQVRQLLGESEGDFAGPNHPWKETVFVPIGPRPVDLGQRRLEHFQPEGRRNIATDFG